MLHKLAVDFQLGHRQRNRANTTMARPRKFSDIYHQKLRGRVADFRARWSLEIKAERERKKLLRCTRNGGDKYPRAFLYEIVDEFGQTSDVIISIEPEPPIGAIRSQFLPSIPLGPRLARMFRDSRLKQIEELRSRDRE
jgi:hypothetical protein